MGLARRVFTSARTTRDSDAVAAVLRVSVHNNVRDGLTSILIHDSSAFAQMVEGERDALDRCMERVRRDPRHARLRVIDLGPVRRRLTRAHPMLLVPASRVRGWPGLDRGLPEPAEVAGLFAGVASARHAVAAPDRRADEVAHHLESLRRLHAAARLIVAEIAPDGDPRRHERLRRVLVRQLDRLRVLRRAAGNDPAIRAEVEAVEALIADAAARGRAP